MWTYIYNLGKNFQTLARAGISRNNTIQLGTQESWCFESLYEVDHHKDKKMTRTKKGCQCYFIYTVEFLQ